MADSSGQRQSERVQATCKGEAMLRAREKGLRRSRHDEFADEREELDVGEKEKKMETAAGLCL